jgi:hypothetical protein
MRIILDPCPLTGFDRFFPFQFQLLWCLLFLSTNEFALLSFPKIRTISIPDVASGSTGKPIFKASLSFFERCHMLV